MSGRRLRGLLGANRARPSGKPGAHGRPSGQPAAPEGRSAGVPSSVPLAAGQRQRVISVLGMHRSGTSSLAGSLEAAGLFLGDVRTSGAWNEKGHRESGVLNLLHEDVLIANGGGWFMPPATATWTRAHRKRRDRFIAEHAGLALWGFKDPRTLLVLEGWLEAIPDLELVGTFRHPAAVARSLQRRHGTDTLEPWLDLWLAYDRPLLGLVEARGFPVVDFDLPNDAYQARIRAVAEDLRLPGPTRDETFFEASLRTSQRELPEELELPPAVAEVYERLRTIAAEQATATAG